ncbi:MAG TPA: sulfurtransferase FdhD, partial [Candidatus Latescibacteria bacterium]|nr:sulfurtransferase FdhD [Candidatus Latescibacterota bacterium]
MPRDDDITVEGPLEIRLQDEAIAVLMRTPGDDLALAAGFLLTE